MHLRSRSKHLLFNTWKNATRVTGRSSSIPRCLSTGKSTESQMKLLHSLDIQIDRSNLLRPNLEPLFDPSHSNGERPPISSLAEYLHTAIEVRGPLTVAEYMRYALTHPEYGYYMKKDVFGQQGDFITSPEISQMFGELIGIWAIATWQAMGQPERIQIVELGPGKGSLQQDFLSAAKAFPSFYRAIEIHLVEVSPVMRQFQQQNLHCIMRDDDDSSGVSDHGLGPSIHWHGSLDGVPQGPSIFIAQEFFDAMPVHQFEYTSKGWCERLVDAKQPVVPREKTSKDEVEKFQFVLSPGPTPAVHAFLGKHMCHEDVDRGDRIEVSPSSIAIVQDISKRLNVDGGAALIIDYGYDHASNDSLRGIQNHKFVSVLKDIGEIDLSIDVDFKTLKHYATKESNVASFGPITQGLFLKEMGIDYRLAALLESTEDEKTAEYLMKSYKRLVESDQMGTIFKVLALCHEPSVGIPVAFNTPSSSSDDESSSN